MKKGFTFSFDMLGEAAMTEADAQRYFNDYLHAIEEVGKDAAGRTIITATVFPLNFLRFTRNIVVLNMIVPSMSFTHA